MFLLLPFTTSVIELPASSTAARRSSPTEWYSASKDSTSSWKSLFHLCIIIVIITDMAATLSLLIRRTVALVLHLPLWDRDSKKFVPKLLLRGILHFA